MKVTLGNLREMVRQGESWRPRPATAVIVAPTPVRSKAIRLYHDEGRAAALEYLDGRRPGSRGLSGTFGSGGKREKQGVRTRDAFARYVEFDLEDGRPAAALGLAADVPMGTHVVSTTVDVVVFAAQEYGYEYSGRVLLWDLAGGTDALSQLLAMPAVLLVEQELGAGTCGDIEIWDLEHGARWRIGRAHALTSAGAISAILDRADATLA